VIYGQFLFGLMMYGVLATASYNETFKASNWFFPVGIVSAVIANVLWMSIAKAEPNSSHLMVKGLIWDSMLMLVYLVVPLLFFGARFTLMQSFGVGLTLIGLLCTKL
jgi:multidrug transporter EmrE-like cation transporter